MKKTALDKVYSLMPVRTVSTQDGCTVYRMEDERGHGTMACWHLFGGIDLFFSDFSMTSSYLPDFPSCDVLEINHCREGSYRCDFSDGSMLTMGEGDLAVCRVSGERTVGSCFPTHRYKGLCLVVDLDRAQESLARLPADMTVDLRRLTGRLCPEDICFCSPASAGVQNLLADLYMLSPLKDRGIFKLRVLELFLYLDNLTSRRQLRPSYSPSRHIPVLKEVERYIRETPEESIPLEELSQRFGLGLTTLKQCFRAQYGCPPATYRKVCRMQQAARLLGDSGLSITEIAGRSGYENLSKFSSAFRSVMGVSPRDYRALQAARMEWKTASSE